MRITGAYMPQGSNAVLIQEDADLKDGFVRPQKLLRLANLYGQPDLILNRGMSSPRPATC